MSLYGKIKAQTNEFFCLDDSGGDETRQLWLERRRRMLNRKCGKLKCDGGALGHRDVIDGISSEGEGQAGESEDETVSKVPVWKLSMKPIALAAGAVNKFMSTKGSRRPSDGQSVSEPAARAVTAAPPVSEEEVQLRLQENFEREVRRLQAYPDQFYGRPKGAQPFQAEQTWHVEGRRSPKRSIKKNIIESIMENSDRQFYGIGFLAKLFNRQVRRDLPPDVKKAIDDLDDFRPYFTYWITAVQILILFISISAYGFGPSGFSTTAKLGTVLVTSLSLQQVAYYEPDNFWIGPRAADLIHLGAKFSPCMRKDKLVYTDIEEQRAVERSTACCIRNDESGCVQTTQEMCSDRLSTWMKWNNDTSEPPRLYNSLPRMSGTVCGQDPRYCEEPASVYPYEWLDDITQWPICRKAPSGRAQADRHMSCDLIGRPCCIGVYGKCEIATREYCEFVNGRFHDDATLCSQVSCMSDVCGMMPFFTKESPNQIYRLWTSLFLHAGLVHLLMTVWLQWYIMRDMEKFIGSLRICIIYIVSGIAGNMASAIFVPYRAEVGPSGCQFGLLACMIVEVINSWEILEEPKKSLLRLCSIASFLFLMGLLPWIDNYAHIFGFITGFLLSLALLPYVTITLYNTKSQQIQVYVSIASVCILMILLVCLFYIAPIYKCEWCQYLNCISFTKDWCVNQGIKIERLDRL